MAQKMTRKELLKQDDFVEAAPDIIDWLQHHKSRIVQVGGSLLAIAAVFLAWNVWAERNAKASSKLLADGLRALDPAPTATTPAPQPRLDAALAAFEEAASRGGSRPQGLVAAYYRGVALTRLGRPGDAVPILRDLVSRADNRLLADSARAMLAQALEGSGETDAAAEILRGLSREPDASFPADVALVRLGKLLARQGKSAEARQTLQEALSRFPQSASTVEARAALDALDGADQ